MSTAETSRSGHQARRGGDYEVGYGKPPVEHRFKPGLSGNNKGRPRKMKNLDHENSIAVFADAVEIFAEKFEINERGRKKNVSYRKVAVRRYLNAAVKSDDPKVLGDLVKYIERVDRAIYEGLGEIIMKIIVEGGLPDD